MVTVTVMLLVPNLKLQLAGSVASAALSAAWGFLLPASLSRRHRLRPGLCAPQVAPLLLNAALLSRARATVHFKGIWTRYGITPVNCRLLFSPLL